MESNLTIIMPHKLSQLSFHDIQMQLNDKNIRKCRTINFDFSPLTFISPFGMMLFIILIEHLIYNLFKTVNISLINHNSEESLRCLAILTRLGFFQCLPIDVNYITGKPLVNDSLLGSNPSIIEITQLKTEESSLDIINKAKKAILRNTNYDKTHVSDIAIMISEIVQNIFIHSECHRPSLIAIQSFPKIQKVQLAIADSGIGIPETLKKVKNFSNVTADYLLIREALKASVSQFQETENRGEGLLRCRIIAKKHFANLFVRSNAGYYFLDFKNNKSGNAEMPFLLGTQFFIDFPINTN